MTATRLSQQDVQEFIRSLYEGDFYAKQVLSSAKVTLGVSLVVHAFGTGLFHAQGPLNKHGVK